MKKSLKVILSTLVICLTMIALTGCGINSSQIKKDIKDEMLMLKIDNEDVQFEVKKVSIENRKKSENTEEIDCEISLTNDYYNAHVYYKLNYVYFDGNGWMLEDYSSYKDPSIIPVQGVSEEKLDIDLYEYPNRELISKEFDKKTLVEIYEFNVDEKMDYLSYKGVIKVTYTFDKNKWNKDIDGSGLDFDLNVDGKWKSRVYYTATETSPYTLAVNIKKLDDKYVMIDAGMSIGNGENLNFNDVHGKYPYEFSSEYLNAKVQFDLPKGLKCRLSFDGRMATQSIDILPSNTLNKIE